MYIDVHISGFITKNQVWIMYRSIMIYRFNPNVERLKQAKTAHLCPAAKLWSGSHPTTSANECLQKCVERMHHRII